MGHVLVAYLIITFQLLAILRPAPRLNVAILGILPMAHVLHAIAIITSLPQTQLQKFALEVFTAI